MRNGIFITLLILLFILATVAFAQSKEVYLFPVTQNGKCGYINRKGRIIIPLKFEEYCLNFSEGLASVGWNGKLGFINKNGDFVIKPKFDPRVGGVFNDGLAFITVNDTNGYVDKAEKLTLLPEYSYVRSFTEGVAVVERDNYVGYIDKNFKLVMPLKFKYASEFSDGRAFVIEADESSYYIDQAGRKMNYPSSGKWWLFADGLATTELDGKEGYMNLKGEVVIKQQFDEAKRFSYGMAAVKIKDKWGFIDRTGRIVVQPQFDEVEDFDLDGIAAVGKYVGVGDGKYAKIDIFKYGFINRRGQMVIGFKFDGASSFRGGLAGIEMDNKFGYVDATGKIIWQPSK